MTMLASWVGVDSRSTSSLYIVSDSRLTDGRGGVTNRARKVYACGRQPHIFGYAGWSDYPRAALERLVEAIDGGLFTKTDNLSIRHCKATVFLKESLSAALRQPNQHVYSAPFSIVHGARQGSGVHSEFRLWILEWVPGKGWHIRTRQNWRRSGILFSSGSSGRDLRRFVRAWQKSDAANTSRAIFSAFCDALTATSDSSTGGAPQLVGLFRKGAGRIFPVVCQKSRYLAGRKVDSVEVDERFCPNDLFERVDIVSMKLLPNAQRQPRPRSIKKPIRRSIFDALK